MMTGMLIAGMLLQDPGSPSSGNTQLLTIFVGVAAASLLIMALAVVVLAIGGMRLQKEVEGIIHEVKVKAMPVIASTETILRDLTPKVKVLSENLVETSHVVRAKVQEFESTLTSVNETIKDASQKTQAQVGRMDSIVTTTITRTAALADTIHASIRKPVNEVAGVVNGFKAGLDVLLSQAKDLRGYRRPRP